MTDDCMTRDHQVIQCSFLFFGLHRGPFSTFSASQTVPRVESQHRNPFLELPRCPFRAMSREVPRFQSSYQTGGAIHVGMMMISGSVPPMRRGQLDAWFRSLDDCTFWRDHLYNQKQVHSSQRMIHPFFRSMSGP